MEEIVPIFVVGMLFIGLPWIILHYVTKWKTAATITTDDEVVELFEQDLVIIGDGRDALRIADAGARGA